jgi:hypothetical protein
VRSRNCGRFGCDKPEHNHRNSAPENPDGQLDSEKNAAYGRRIMQMKDGWLV